MSLDNNLLVHGQGSLMFMFLVPEIVPLKCYPVADDVGQQAKLMPVMLPSHTGVRFKFQLLQFQVSSQLMCLGKQ